MEIGKDIIRYAAQKDGGGGEEIDRMAESNRESYQRENELRSHFPELEVVKTSTIPEKIRMSVWDVMERENFVGLHNPTAGNMYLRGEFYTEIIRRQKFLESNRKSKSGVENPMGKLFHTDKEVFPQIDFVQDVPSEKFELLPGMDAKLQSRLEERNLFIEYNNQLILKKNKETETRKEPVIKELKQMGEVFRAQTMIGDFFGAFVGIGSLDHYTSHLYYPLKPNQIPAIDNYIAVNRAPEIVLTTDGVKPHSKEIIQAVCENRGLSENLKTGEVAYQQLRWYLLVSRSNDPDFIISWKKFSELGEKERVSKELIDNGKSWNTLTDPEKTNYQDRINNSFYKQFGVGKEEFDYLVGDFTKWTKKGDRIGKSKDGLVAEVSLIKENEKGLRGPLTRWGQFFSYQQPLSRMKAMDSMLLRLAKGNNIAKDFGYMIWRISGCASQAGTIMLRNEGSKYPDSFTLDGFPYVDELAQVTDLFGRQKYKDIHGGPEASRGKFGPILANFFEHTMITETHNFGEPVYKLKLGSGTEERVAVFVEKDDGGNDIEVFYRVSQKGIVDKGARWIRKAGVVTGFDNKESLFVKLLKGYNPADFTYDLEQNDLTDNETQDIKKILEGYDSLSSQSFENVRWNDQQYWMLRWMFTTRNDNIGLYDYLTRMDWDPNEVITKKFWSNVWLCQRVAIKPWLVEKWVDLFKEDWYEFGPRQSNEDKLIVKFLNLIEKTDTLANQGKITPAKRETYRIEVLKAYMNDQWFEGIKSTPMYTTFVKGENIQLFKDNQALPGKNIEHVMGSLALEHGINLGKGLKNWEEKINKELR
ncbi:hypothetical protein KJ570_01005 [Patescibacteria group bacterium]|nr:hypothetical protein [Patescibacteria group bacterium]MBU2036555.1 hypothetical protein [Patescibacteria group bacterium]